MTENMLDMQTKMPTNVGEISPVHKKTVVSANVNKLDPQIRQIIVAPSNSDKSIPPNKQVDTPVKILKSSPETKAVQNVKANAKSVCLANNQKGVSANVLEPNLVSRVVNPSGSEQKLSSEINRNDFLDDQVSSSLCHKVDSDANSSSSGDDQRSVKRPLTVSLSNVENPTRDAAMISASKTPSQQPAQHNQANLPSADKGPNQLKCSVPTKVNVIKLSAAKDQQVNDGSASNEQAGRRNLHFSDLVKKCVKTMSLKDPKVHAAQDLSFSRQTEVRVSAMDATEFAQLTFLNMLKQRQGPAKSAESCLSKQTPLEEKQEGHVKRQKLDKRDMRTDSRVAFAGDVSIIDGNGEKMLLADKASQRKFVSPPGRGGTLSKSRQGRDRQHYSNANKGFSMPALATDFDLTFLGSNKILPQHSKSTSVPPLPAAVETTALNSQTKIPPQRLNLCKSQATGVNTYTVSFTAHKSNPALRASLSDDASMVNKKLQQESPNHRNLLTQPAKRAFSQDNSVKSLTEKLANTKVQCN